MPHRLIKGDGYIYKQLQTAGIQIFRDGHNACCNGTVMRMTSHVIGLLNNTVQRAKLTVIQSKHMKKMGANFMECGNQCQHWQIDTIFRDLHKF